MTFTNLPVISSVIKAFKITTPGYSRAVAVNPVTLVDERGWPINPPYNAAQLDKFLRNGSAFNINGNYATPTIFSYTPAAGEVAWVDAITWHIHDNGMTMDGFGGNPTLANGFTFKLLRGAAVILDLFDGDPVKQTGAIGSHIFKTSTLFDPQAGGDTFSFYFDIRAIRGTSWILDGDDLDKIEFTAADNLTGITRNTVKIFGKTMNKADIA